MADEQPPVSPQNSNVSTEASEPSPASGAAASGVDQIGRVADGSDAPVEAGAAPSAPLAPAIDATPADDQAAIDELLKQANFEDPSAVATLPPALEAASFDLPNFQQVIRDAQVSSIDLLRDVELNVKIELGRSRMLVEDVLKLGEGSVVELDKLAGDPVDVFVNDRLVARGEVLVLNDNFCVRVNEIVAGAREEGL